MTAQTVIPQWTLRLQAFEKVAHDLGDHYRTQGAPVSLLAQVLDNLKCFASEMFDFFNSNFPDAGHFLNPSEQNPPDNIYSRILEQFGNDLEIIQRAAEQRLSAPSSMQDTLRITDYLVARLIAPAVAGGLLEEGTQAITYFQKSATVRVMPYVGLALIGVPYSVLEEPRDLLSIPHEVGHYIFWHGRSEPTPPVGSKYHLSRVLFEEALNSLKGLMNLDHPDFDKWCYVWLEEMFADVVACWLAGPSPALSIQDLASSHSQSSFITSDDDHPVALIRPYLHTKALAYQGTPAWQSAARLLRDQWDVSARQNYAAFKLRDGGDISVSQATVSGYSLDTSRPVDCLMNVILNRLKKFTALLPDDWRASLDAPTSIQDLGKQFDDFQRNLPALERANRQTAELTLPGESSYRQWVLNHLDWPSDDSKRSQDQAALNMKQLLKNQELPAGTTIDESEWQAAAATGGWTTEPSEIPWPH